MKRIMKEVGKVKDILSANKETSVKIEELDGSTSLITTVERK
jgi:molecular chaperone DnaK (HSP70)